jgi:hypothetical protein
MTTHTDPATRRPARTPALITAAAAAVALAAGVTASCVPQLRLSS